MTPRWLLRFLYATRPWMSNRDAQVVNDAILYDSLPAKCSIRFPKGPSVYDVYNLALWNKGIGNITSSFSGSIFRLVLLRSIKMPRKRTKWSGSFLSAESIGRLLSLIKEILAIKRGLSRLIRQLNDLLLTRPLHSNMLPTFITAQQINSKTLWACWAYSNIEGHSEYREMISHNTVNRRPLLFQLYI